MYAAINLLNSYTGINILSCFKSIFCCFKIYYIREIYICVYIYKLLLKVLYVKHVLHVIRNMQFEFSTPNNTCKW